jgi:hypothetical protein
MILFPLVVWPHSFHEERSNKHWEPYSAESLPPQQLQWGFQPGSARLMPGLFFQPYWTPSKTAFAICHWEGNFILKWVWGSRYSSAIECVPSVLQAFGSVSSATNQNLSNPLDYNPSATECLCPSEFLCWNLKPQCDGLRRWDLWEVRSWEWKFTHKNNVLIKKTPPQGTLLPLLPYENTVRRQMSMD